MSKRRILERALCLTLSLVVGVLSYRATTAILSVAGLANNPTEGRIPVHSADLNVRDNKPRPAKHRLTTRLPRIPEVDRSSDVDPLLRQLVLLQEGTAGSAHLVRPVETRRPLEHAKPLYLRPFLHASTASPQSPPA